MNRGRSVLAFLFLSTLASGARAEDGQLSRISAQALPTTEEPPVWNSCQFARADKAGRVYLLRCDTLDIYQILGNGEIVARGKLRPSAPFDTASMFRDATMSPAGDAWAILDFDFKVHLFRGGEEKAVPPVNWIPRVLAVPNGELTALVFAEFASMGKEAGPAVRPSRLPSNPPFLLQLDGSDWNTLVEGEVPRVAEIRSGIGHELRAANEYWLAVDAKGALWVAARNAYRLKKYSPTGKLLTEIQVGDGKVKFGERSEKELRRARTLGGNFNLPKSRAERIVRAMTIGRDRRVYLLVDTADGLGLDRYDPDPVRNVVERVLVDGVTADRMTVAAGTHGLYLAALEGNRGRWVISWESLESAKWQPVPEARIYVTALELLRLVRNYR